MTPSAPGGAAETLPQESLPQAPLPVHPGAPAADAVPAGRSTARPAGARLLGVVTALAALGAATWVFLAPAGLAVTQVQVTGLQRVPVAAVRDAAAPELGRSLFLTDLEAVARRVRALPGVREATVTRDWPAGLVVAVQERVVAAALPVPGGVSLVDVEGIQIGSAPRAPGGVPLLRVDPVSAGPRAVRAAVAVHRGLPAPVRRLVLEIGARTPDAVWLQLRDGSRVSWGSFQDGDVKASALLALRRGMPGGPGVGYDVSAPQAPSVSGTAVAPDGSARAPRR